MDAVLFRTDSSGVRVTVHVTPGSRSERMMRLRRSEDGGNVLGAAVTARAKEGEANIALIRLLSKTWRVPKSSVTIASGRRGRRKIVHIEGEPNGLAFRLNGWAKRIHD